VGELHEEELRERARLARQARGQPLLRDAEHLGEQPDLHVGVEAVFGRPVGPRFAVGADVLAELARLADGVHDLAEEVFVGQFLGIPAREARGVLGFEFLDLGGGDPLEIGAHRVPLPSGSPDPFRKNGVADRS
jgi:hypothetical protein